ncbi:MAG: hypothetical protein ACOY0T_17545 [Myxococcota bacterium]
MQTKSQVIQDSEGSVSLCWLTPSVLYARYERSLSAEVGQAVAATLQVYASRVPSFEFYIDASKLTQYDLRARSAFIRVVGARRETFANLVMLAWKGGVTTSSPQIIQALGEPCEILTDANEFDLRLLRIVPNAPQILASLRNLAREQRGSTTTG